MLQSKRFDPDQCLHIRIGYTKRTILLARSGNLKVRTMLAQRPRYEQTVDEICDLKWSNISRKELMAIAVAYRYFSVQFCETVELACARHPDDRMLYELRD